LWNQFRKIFILDLGEAQDSELFFNKTIKRRLPSSGVSLVLESLAKRGRAEWIDSKKRRTYVYWRRPEEWGSAIHRWIQKTGKSNTVCTLYELRALATWPSRSYNLRRNPRSVDYK
jgi:ESCRT-II complex subunit VPS25